MIKNRETKIKKRSKKYKNGKNRIYTPRKSKMKRGLKRKKEHKIEKIGYIPII